ncbi:ABC transporter permease [uncultured Sphingomonas sp.]|uniref:ABC transporter permease n=1 Tax=uncultured Sphingomonas sp. TaxID=158754 RepID=UPI0035CC3FB2
MSALTSLFRSFGRHRLFAALNIGGLALGIAAFLVLALYVRFETGYDRALPGENRTWIVSEQYTRVGDPSDPNQHTMGGELDQLRGDFPQLQGTRFWNNNATVLQGDQVTGEDVSIVDPNFFAFFPYPAVVGDPVRTLADPDGLVITEKTATKFFGAQSPIGRTLTLKIFGKPYAYRVGAVLRDLPANTSFADEMFVPLVRARHAQDFFDHWGSTTLFTFLRFPDTAAAQAFSTQQLPGFLARHAYPGGNVTKGNYYQFLTPLGDYHLTDPADRALVTTLSVVGLLALLIAVVNYVNLATARAGLRAREVAVRKVLGGTRRALVGQFLGEAIATVGLAALVGLALAELALPFVNAAGGTHLAIRYWGLDGVLLPIVALALIVGTLAGLYPAFLLSSFRPAAVLASARAPGGGRAGVRLRGGLVVFQFAVAVAFTISTGVMLAQTAHVANADIGFRREGLIVVQSFTDDGLDAAQKAGILAAFARTPGVVSVGSGLNAPGDQYSTNADTINRPSTPSRAPLVSRVDIGPGYFDTVGTQLVAGRLFDAAHPADDLRAIPKEARAHLQVNVVLNETAVHTIGFANAAEAIDQPLAGFNGYGSAGGMHVIGVFADQRFTSPHDRVYPTAYVFTTKPFEEAFALVRHTGDARATIDRLEATWKRVVPQVPFRARSAQDNLYRRWYKADADRSRLFTIGAVLAVVIGCIGLYGLAAFDTARRVKEIGIRKTLGASTGDVLRLLLGKFMRPVVAANLIAWPVAYVLMRRWLAGFDDRINLSVLYFLAAGLGAAAIAAATVFGQSWRIARREPARALRYE